MKDERIDELLALKFPALGMTIGEIQETLTELKRARELLRMLANAAASYVSAPATIENQDYFVLVRREYMDSIHTGQKQARAFLEGDELPPPPKD